MDAEQEDKIAHFVAISGSDPQAARTALNATNWNLQEAITLWMAGNDSQDTAQPPTASSSRNPRASSNQHSNSVTIRDYQHEESDDESDDKDDEFYAGGGKSGLAVQNPNSGGPTDHYRSIMSQAQESSSRHQGNEEDQPPPRRTYFTGRAQTLGGDNTPSRIIDAGPNHTEPARVERTLHLWVDGISIDDGPLYRFDDPANEDMMKQIQSGRAPLGLLNVQREQEVELILVPHQDEKYTPPKQPYQPFSGQGQRLGSPTPGPSTRAPAAPSQPQAQPAAAEPSQPSVNIDSNTPVLRIQIRLGDGTRLQSRFNTTHTIGDVYDFINRASMASNSRNYVLMTTFPPKDFTDKSRKLGDIDELKKGGGSLVQKWC
ncbi:SEP-domain-containing protein [Piedraia hortae CBS 480.64]|uniref:SEP-domain-containing protein n=1 Tax=Piedraia hortae CBS 480.64 TaxID=1314780 RepID=A0A6A7BY70_9PEZI|nr:SEP-domain-containing protein [Piedraia hortae CBS 480.64]